MRRTVLRTCAALLPLLAAWPAVQAQAPASSAPPRRIVSLMPSLTETVCALGECERLVGVDRYSSWPARVERLPRLGGMDDPQIERIVGLRPDVVLAVPSSRAVERLQSLGLKVVVLESRTTEEARRTAETIDWEHVNDSFAEALIRAWRSGTASPPAAVPLRTQEAES